MSTSKNVRRQKKHHSKSSVRSRVETSCVTGWFIYSWTERRWWRATPWLAAQTASVGGLVRLGEPSRWQRVIGWVVSVWRRNFYPRSE